MYDVVDFFSIYLIICLIEKNILVIFYFVVIYFIVRVSLSMTRIYTCLHKYLNKYKFKKSQSCHTFVNRGSIGQE